MKAGTLTRSQSMFDLNRLAAGIISGLVGGIAGGFVAGIGARLAMRAVALLGEQPTGFTIEGTLFIIVFGVFLGGLAGLVFGIIQSFLPGSVRLKGFLFGLLLSLAITLIALLTEPEGELALVSQAALAILFAPIPLAYGLVLGQVAARLSPGGELPIESTRPVRIAGLLTVLGVLVGAGYYAFRALTHSTMSRSMIVGPGILGDLVGAILVLTPLIAIGGLVRSGAAGNDRLAKIGLGISLLGSVSLAVVALAMIFFPELFRGVYIRTREMWAATPFLLLGLGMLLAGIAVLRSGRWPGWRRYAPLVAGLYLALMVVVLVLPLPYLIYLPGSSSAERLVLGQWLGTLFALSWLPLGIALRTESDQA